MAKKISKKKNAENILIRDSKSIVKFINYNKNKELVWTIAFMILLFVALFGTSALFKSFNHFTYKGLSFTKEKFGTIPVFHHYYYFTDSATGRQYQYNLYVRIDPRENNVPVSGSILFRKNMVNYVTVNGAGLTNCSTTLRDLGSLAELFSANLLQMKPGSMNTTEALANNMTYITCETKPDNNVLQVFAGNETRIDIEGNCYNIQIANCQTLEAIEKFKVETVVDALERHTKK